MVNPEDIIADVRVHLVSARYWKQIAQETEDCKALAKVGARNYDLEILCHLADIQTARAKLLRSSVRLLLVKLEKRNGKAYVAGEPVIALKKALRGGKFKEWAAYKTIFANEDNRIPDRWSL